MSAAIRYRIVIPMGVQCAIQIDVKECREAAGIDEEAYDAAKDIRAGCVVHMTIDQLAKLASSSERSSGWDMEPQGIAGCNRFAKRVSTFVEHVRKHGDICSHCHARREFHAGNNYTGSAPSTGCRRFKPTVTL